MRASQDRWASWLLERRGGGDPEQLQVHIDYLAPIRDKVLDNASIQPGETLLDLGSGDGLIPFAALDRVGPNGAVIFSDISRDLLDHARELATEAGVAGQCRFVEMAAEDLSPIDSDSIDNVTTRSVLIYVADKQRAFDEIHRVLRPGGRLSIFEPINGYNWPELADQFMQMDVAPVREIAAKVKAGYEAAMGNEGRSMIDFDERDLVRFAGHSGFSEIHLELQIDVQPADPMSWETFLNTAFNPCAPTLNELFDSVLTDEERDRFTPHLRQQFEHPNRRWASAFAYLWAVK